MMGDVPWVLRFTTLLHEPLYHGASDCWCEVLSLTPVDAVKTAIFLLSSHLQRHRIDCIR